MLKVYLVGFQDFKFKADDGGEIDGVKLFFLEEMEISTSNYGYKPAEKFVKRITFDSFGISVSKLSENVMTEVEMLFNSKGRLVDIKLIIPNEEKKKGA